MAAVKLSPLFSFAFFLKCQHLSTEENYFKIDTHDISKLDIKFWKVVFFFFFFAITVISHKIKSSKTF